MSEAKMMESALADLYAATGRVDLLEHEVVELAARRIKGEGTRSVVVQLQDGDPVVVDDVPHEDLEMLQIKGSRPESDELVKLGAAFVRAKSVRMVMPAKTVLPVQQGQDWWETVAGRAAEGPLAKAAAPVVKCQSIPDNNGALRHLKPAICDEPEIARAHVAVTVDVLGRTFGRSALVAKVAAETAAASVDGARSLVEDEATHKAGKALAADLRVASRLLGQAAEAVDAWLGQRRCPEAKQG